MACFCPLAKQFVPVLTKRSSKVSYKIYIKKKKKSAFFLMETETEKNETRLSPNCHTPSHTQHANIAEQPQTEQLQVTQLKTREPIRSQSVLCTPHLQLTSTCQAFTVYAILESRSCCAHDTKVYYERATVRISMCCSRRHFVRSRTWLF